MAYKFLRAMKWIDGANGLRMEAPVRVMIVGASTNPAKFGNKAVRAYLRQGHEVFPVNPRAATIEGLRCYPDVASVPGHIDRVALYLPPPLALEAIKALAARGQIGEVFFNPGTESREAIELAERAGLNPVQACAIVDVGVSPYSI